MRDYTPRPFAPLAMDHLRNVPRSNLWAGMGLGKTSIVLTYLDIAHNVWGDSEPTLVLGPLRVAENTWVRERAKWRHLQDLEVISATGDKPTREAALRRDVPVVCINYDQLPWLRDHYAGRAWPFRRVVADESTRLKGFRLRQGGQRAQALAQFAHTQVKEWVNLTGTPSPNGLKDLWGQQWFIDAGQRLGRTYDAFEQRWFGYKRVTDAISKKPGIQPVIFPFAQEQIQERLADCSLTIDPKDWFDLQAPIVNVIEVDLPKAARAKYRELEREMFAHLTDTQSVEVFNAAALSLKCLQLANGAVYLDPDRYGPDASVEVHAAKLEALDSVIEEAGGAPVLVAYHFKSDLARIQRAYPDCINVGTTEGLLRAQAGEGRVWVGHPASMGHGVDGLQEHCNTVCFFGQWWDLEQHDQMVERVGPVRQMQAGKDRPVFIHYLVASGTVDEVVMARRGSKRNVQELLLDYMKGKR